MSVATSAPTPAATTLTDPKQDTYIDALQSLGEGVLLYRPEDNSFLALYDEEWFSIRADALSNVTPIEALQEANATATEKAVALRDLQKKQGVSKAELEKAERELATALNDVAAKAEEAKKKIEPIKTLSNDPNQFYELVPLTMKRVVKSKGGHESRRLITPIYVKADKLKSVLADKRVYLVEGDAERKKQPKEKILNGTSLNTDEIKRRIADKVQDKAKFAKKWKLAPKDADVYSGILFDWAKTMGADTKAFLERTQEELVKQILPASLSHDKNNPYRSIDLAAEAQLMRWAGGAGLELNFSPFQGSLFDKRDKDWKDRAKRAAKTARFGIKANAEASFAVGEAKVETIAYMPHYSGWEMSPEVLGQPFNFGYFRAQGDLLLYGLAGASIALEADLGIMLTGDKQGVKGTPKGQKGAKVKAGAKGSVELFAGIKEGVQLSGALQWLNPEGVLGTGKPKKLKPNQAIAEFADIAKVSLGAEAIEGLAAKLGFECAFRNGSFRIAADANLCLGLGGGGKVAGDVGVATIGDFFMCVCHMLKQGDYKKMMAVMEEDTFKTFNKILFLVEAEGYELKSFATTTLDRIEQGYKDAINDAKRKGREFLQQLEQRLSSQWGWFAYMPPEGRSTLMLAINDARMSAPGDRDVQLAAAFCANELLCTTQTNRHLDKTLERFTYDMGSKSDKASARLALASMFNDTVFDGALEKTESRLAGVVEPMIGQPFLRNDEPSFFAATFPLNGAIYTA
ncbi:MAG: hypothetical protein H6R13_2199 [Proteobacteria bacterium]|nr:hypothetical protein [Pseudomonadota bacterium]